MIKKIFAINKLPYYDDYNNKMIISDKSYGDYLRKINDRGNVA